MILVIPIFFPPLLLLILSRYNINIALWRGIISCIKVHKQNHLKVINTDGETWIHLRIHLVFTQITQELQIAEKQVFYLKMYKWTKARKTTAHFENANPLLLPHQVLELFPEEALDQLSQYHSLKIIICNFVKWNWKSKTLYETYILQDNTIILKM